MDKSFGYLFGGDPSGRRPWKLYIYIQYSSRSVRECNAKRRGKHKELATPTPTPTSTLPLENLPDYKNNASMPQYSNVHP